MDDTPHLRMTNSSLSVTKKLMERRLLLPIIDVHCSDLSIVIEIHVIDPTNSAMSSLGHAGEVGRAVAASVGRALGEDLIEIVLIGPDIGGPVALLLLIEEVASYACQWATRAGNCTFAFAPVAVVEAERVADGFSIDGCVGNG